MKRIKKLVASVGTYTDNQGQEKTRYHTMGSLFKREDGSICLKMDSMPLGEGWNGWVNVYDLDPDQGQQKASPPPQPASEAPNNLDDDVPF